MPDYLLRTQIPATVYKQTSRITIDGLIERSFGVAALLQLTEPPEDGRLPPLEMPQPAVSHQHGHIMVGFLALAPHLNPLMQLPVEPGLAPHPLLSQLVTALKGRGKKNLKARKKKEKISDG